MSDVAESAGLPATVDFLFAIMRTEELDEQGQLMIKQIKSRFNDTNYYKRFVIGVQINKFKLHDVDNEEQSLSDMGKVDDTPIFDKSKFGGAMKQRGDTSSINFD
jgi:hypothetical protein